MYSEEFEFSLALVKKCGEVIKSAFNVEKKISEKSAANDLVTETDQLVEKMLIGGLREKYPDTMFIGEESVAAGEKCELTEKKTWIIDPTRWTNQLHQQQPSDMHHTGVHGGQGGPIWYCVQPYTKPALDC
eukprot:TRINITY_DN15874_c0_g1_i1.p1 TRINITY_DN15874_c0_g1~~TRINITY_DN15874_c0_g1_i1.p1  ORF type:complete len:131 (+),score=41.98 TRINITY_DN15874_c0_g1_i1:78-470(+)